MASFVGIRHGVSQPKLTFLSFQRNVSTARCLFYRHNPSIVSPVNFKQVGLQVLAAKKGLSQKKRVRQSAASRLVNRERKARLKTQAKIVVKLGRAFMMPENLEKIKAESDIQELDIEISKAQSILDRAYNKGTFKRNMCRRKKRKLSMLRQQILMAAGIYTPTDQDLQ
eukprot:TRINITY_DN1108_c0_g1_i1.p3 TRINITY_DN1108_c0_g1~~TRINITY_DN1108_c0_g1_i1.p3  ORF type:complete len:169 (-),score=7.14 TRINITY_DN1108_c0_g1_i1:156-662(-)